MQHEELIHRFFDEGLDDALQDVLFEQMATDAELRGSFLDHVKLHSILQEDFTAITTPAHVEAELMEVLGVEPAATAAGRGAPLTVFRESLRRGRMLLARKRGYIVTAGITAGLTVLLMAVFGVPERATDSAPQPRQTDTRTQESRQLRAPQHDVRQHMDADASDGTPQSGVTSDGYTTRPHSARGHTSPAAVRERATADARVPAHRSAPAGAVEDVGTPPVGHAGVGASASGDAGAAAGTPFEAGRGGHVDVIKTQSPGSIRVRYHDVPDGIRLASRETIALDLQPATEEVPVPDAATEPWHMFHRRHQASVLANMVFELRKMYGRSDPYVDLPHNSHTVFEDMAISAVYKISDHHAFGFEYGREAFGMEYSSHSMTDSRLDPSNIERTYDPPLPWMAAGFREHRMLDVVGAVWKLSLPEYGVFDFIYPYSRAFLGATTQGPLGKLRMGLEMFPSNFSMLNVGVEFGLLRYYVEQVSYNTTRISFTFGVAVGF